jgi:crotonobetainyl-CoA:carnitine CoA-transferase CaiB-like acyl-CoA transferase
MTKPLAGIRVLDVGSFVFGPVTSVILGDWGAEVIKIEPPRSGDPVRNVSAWGVPACVDGVRYVYEFSNRGKKDLGLDIGRPEGREVLLRLVDSADVFVTNFLPVTRRKLRIDPKDIMARNPSIVYGRASGQGTRGPQAEDPGFDAMTYWARSGAAIGVTPPEGSYPLAMPGPGFGDVQSAMALAGGIGTALYQRERTGKGSIVDVSLLAAGLWATGMTLLGASVTGRDTLDHQGHFGLQNPLINSYRTRDGGYITLVFLQPDRYWRDFCLIVGKEEWLVDPRLVDADARREHSATCISLLDELFAEYGFEEWCEILSRQPGQWDVVNSPGRALADPDAAANGYIQRIANDGAEDVTLVAAPVQFDEEVPTLTRAPAFGADTDDILADLGLTNEEVAELRQAGVVG